MEAIPPCKSGMCPAMTLKSMQRNNLTMTMQRGPMSRRNAWLVPHILVEGWGLLWTLPFRQCSLRRRSTLPVFMGMSVITLNLKTVQWNSSLARFAIARRAMAGLA